MLDPNRSFQSAPIRFQFKFKGNLVACSFIRIYTLSEGRKLIIYKVLLNKVEYVKQYGHSVNLTIDEEGKFILPLALNEEETQMFAKLTAAIKSAAYLNRTSRDFRPQ